MPQPRVLPEQVAEHLPTRPCYQPHEAGGCVLGGCQGPLGRQPRGVRLSVPETDTGPSLPGHPLPPLDRGSRFSAKGSLWGPGAGRGPGGGWCSPPQLSSPALNGTETPERVGPWGWRDSPLSVSLRVASGQGRFRARLSQTHASLGPQAQEGAVSAPEGA